MGGLLRMVKDIAEEDFLGRIFSLLCAIFGIVFALLADNVCHYRRGCGIIK